MVSEEEGLIKPNMNIKSLSPNFLDEVKRINCFECESAAPKCSSEV